MRGLAVAFGSLIAVAPALAQQPQQQLERIEITGTNIKRTDVETVAPVQIITRQQLEQSGQSTVADLLRSIPSNSGNSFNETFTNSFSPGSSGIALRGLPQKNTLVLLNGRRVANYGFAQNLQDTFVDLNAIPSSAVERIEILKDGASAVYGSDAIAGVVNIILRKDFRGALAGASYGQSTEKGAGETNVYGAFGFGDIATDRYNVMVAANFFDRDLLKMSDRKITRDQRWFDDDTLSAFGTGGYAWGNARTWRRTPRVPFADCGNGNPGQPIPGAQARSTGTLCLYNPAPYLTLIPETQRAQLVSTGTFQITPSMQGFVDLLYSRNVSKQTFTPTPWSQVSIAFDPATGGVRGVPSLIRNNPFGVAGGVLANYTFFELGGRDSEITTDFYRALGGLKGTAADWDWQFAVGKSNSDTTQKQKNGVRVSVLEGFRDSTTFNWENLASNAGALDALRLNTERKSKSKLDFADFKATRELGQLPGGPIGFAFGLEYRRESINDVPDAALLAGEVLGRGSTATDGSRNNKAAFIEFALPLVKTIEAQAALRYDRYSDFGSSLVPKYGIKFQPTSEFLMRGSVSRGFRAPSLPESAPSSATFFTTVTDPDDPTGRPSQTTAGVARANPDLQPEKSRSINVGFVLAPTADTSLSVDWYDIKQVNVIDLNSFNFILRNPTLFPGQIIRNSAGELVAVIEQWRNIASLVTKGLDIEAKQVVRSGIGRFTFDVTASYLHEYRRQNAAGQPPVDYAGNNKLSAFPRWRGNVGAAWDLASWTAKLTMRYTDGYNQGDPGDFFQERVRSDTQFDLFGEYRITPRLRVNATVLNVEDKKPPFDAFFVQAFSLPYDFTLYDARGRFIRAGLEYKFY